MLIHPTAESPAPVAVHTGCTLDTLAALAAAVDALAPSAEDQALALVEDGPLYAARPTGRYWRTTTHTLPGCTVVTGRWVISSHRGPTAPVADDDYADAQEFWADNA